MYVYVCVCVCVCVCVHLYGRRVPLQTDNLAYQFVVPHAHELEHRCAGHALGDDHYVLRGGGSEGHGSYCENAGYGCVEKR
jgi:hypothetical protein